MTKSGSSMLVFLVVMALWTLLAWGIAGIVGWLPALAGLAQSSSGELAPQLTGLFSLFPSALLDSWLPQLQQLGGWLARYFPMLLSWAGYVVWLVWGLGMVALLLFGALARRFLLNNPAGKFPPRT